MLTGCTVKGGKVVREMAKERGLPKWRGGRPSARGAEGRMGVE